MSKISKNAAVEQDVVPDKVSDVPESIFSTKEDIFYLVNNLVFALCAVIVCSYLATGGPFVIAATCFFVAIPTGYLCIRKLYEIFCAMGPLDFSEAFPMAAGTNFGQILKDIEAERAKKDAAKLN